MKSRITTIKLEKETKQRLDKLKEYKRETYEEIVKKMLFILNTAKIQPEKAQRVLLAIDKKQRGMIKKERKKPQLTALHKFQI